jgi:IPT/TIG domain
MRMNKMTPFLAVAASLLMMGSVAFAQAPPPGDKQARGKMGRLKVRRMLPISGPIGATVTIKGRGFKAGVEIRIGGVKILPTSVSARKLSFTVPPLGAGANKVMLMRGRRSVMAGTYTVTGSTAAKEPTPGHPSKHRAPPAPGTPQKPDPDQPAPGTPQVDPDRPKTDPDQPAPGTPQADPDRPDPDRPKTDPDQPAPGNAENDAQRRRKRWSRMRGLPTVFKFKQSKRKPGVFVIRGRNFAPDTTVNVDKHVVTGAKITPNRIVFQMPAVDGKAVILLRSPKLPRPIFVGVHEATPPAAAAAAPAVDPAAAQKQEQQQEQARRKLARERWAKRRATLAKTRTARLAQYNKRWEELRAKRAARRAKRLETFQSKWDSAFLSNDQVRAELALHAERSARLRQMLGLAEVDKQDKLVVRIQLVIDQETARHDQRMAALKTALAASAGGAQ